MLLERVGRGRRPRGVARRAESGCGRSVSQRTGAPATSARIGPPIPARSVPAGDRVEQRQEKGREARVVKAPPHPLADTRPEAERDGEHQHQPAGDDAAGNGDRAPGGRERARARRRGRSGSSGPAAGRRRGEPRADRPIQDRVRCSPSRLASDGARRAGGCSWRARARRTAVRRPKATRPAARATSQATGSAARVLTRRARRDDHRLARRFAAHRVRGRPAAPASGTRSAPRCRRGRRRPPRPPAGRPERAGSRRPRRAPRRGRRDGHRERSSAGRGAGGRVDEVVERAGRGRSGAGPARRSRRRRRPAGAWPGGRPAPTRVGDGDAPRAALGRAPPQRQVASEVHEPAGQRRPRLPHGLEGARRRTSPWRCRRGRSRVPRATRTRPSSTSTSPPGRQPAATRGGRASRSSKERS